MSPDNKAALTRVTIIVVGAGAMGVEKRARLEHASPPAQVSRAPRTTQQNLVRDVVWLEPRAPRRLGAEIMQKAVRGLLISNELKITQKCPKIITISALVLSAFE